MRQDHVIQFRGTIYENGYGLIAKKVMRDRNISAMAKAIYAYLCSFASTGSEGERSSFPGVSLMKAELGIATDGTFYKYRKQLVDAGYITVEKRSDKDGKFINNIYYIESVPQSKQEVIEKEKIHEENNGEKAPEKEFKPYSENQSMANLPYSDFPSTVKPSSVNRSTIINSTIINSTNNRLIDCRAGAREESIEPNQEIWKALQEHGKIAMVQDTVSLSETNYLPEIHTMLEKHFPSQLDPEVIRIACELFSDRSYDWKNFKIKFIIENPVGYFRACYLDAIKQWKLQRNKKTSLQTNSKRSLSDFIDE